MTEELEKQIADGFILLGLETPESREAFVRMANIGQPLYSTIRDDFEWTDTLRSTSSGE